MKFYSLFVSSVDPIIAALPGALLAACRYWWRSASCFGCLCRCLQTSWFYYTHLWVAALDGQRVMLLLQSRHIGQSIGSRSSSVWRTCSSQRWRHATVTSSPYRTVYWEPFFLCVTYVFQPTVTSVQRICKHIRNTKICWSRQSWKLLWRCHSGA